nr:MAG TPA: Bacterial DNA-binding protein [Caudoviricetes sp.]
MEVGKKEIIRAISKDTGLTLKDSERAYDAMSVFIVATLLNGDDVLMPRLVSFKVKERKAYTLSHSTLDGGRAFNIPARMRASAKVSRSINKRLKEMPLGR